MGKGSERLWERRRPSERTVWEKPCICHSTTKTAGQSADPRDRAPGKASEGGPHYRNSPGARAEAPPENSLGPEYSGSPEWRTHSQEAFLRTHTNCANALESSKSLIECDQIKQEKSPRVALS